MSAARTSLTGISGRNKDNWDSSDSRLISNEDSELIERPIVRPTPLSLTSWLGVKTIPNSGQVLKRQCRIRLLCLLYQLLADIVIHPFLKAAFSPRKPSEQPSSVASAFGLNVSSEFTESVTNRLNLTSIPGLPRGSSGDVAPPKIDTNHFRCLACWWGINLNHQVDVVVTLTTFLERCTRQSLTPKQCDLISTNRQIKINSSTFESYSYSLLSFYIAEGANIQADRSGSEFVDFMSRFGVTNDAPNSLTNVIGFQPCHFSHWLINLVVKLGCIPAVILFGNFQYLVTSISESLQSLIDFWSILYRDYKLALHRQGLSHNNIVAHPDCRRLKPLTCVPLRSKDTEFPKSGGFLMNSIAPALK